MNFIRETKKNHTSRDTKHKLWLFRAIMFVIPILFFFSLEVGLRAFNYGTNLELFIPNSEVNDKLVANPAVELRYFSNEGKTGFGSDDVFAKAKKKNTFRIFVLGGSSTAGYPYFYNASFSKMMKQRLAHAYPKHNIEIVNLGMTAVNSYTVRDFAKECLLHDPDLLIVYAGHNEFYGALGLGATVGSFFTQNRFLTLAYLSLKKLKIYQLVNNLISASDSKADHVSGKDINETLMARMVKEQSIRHGSQLFEKTIKNYRENLQDIVAWAQKRNVPVLLGTLASNIKDQPPFDSIQSSKKEDQPLAKLRLKAAALLENGDYSQSCKLLDEVISRNPEDPLSYFQAGKCYEQLGSYKLAHQNYTLAKDYDGIRFRAPEAINQVIQEFSKEDNVYVSDTLKALQEGSTYGLIGDELMTDHLHPNLRGNLLLAKAFSEIIENESLLFRVSGQPKVAPKQHLSDDELYSKAAVTQLDLRAADYRIEILTSGWPFKNHRRAKTISDFKPETKVDEVALKLLNGELDYWQGHVNMTTYYMEQGEIELALQECKALLVAFPHHWKSHRWMGLNLLAIGRYEEALPPLKKAAHLSDDPVSHKWAGTILLQRQNPEEAIPFLEEAIIFDPRDHEAAYNLSVAYFITGQRVLAAKVLEKVLAERPDFPEARNLYLQFMGN